jgi:hypothetical protein
LGDRRNPGIRPQAGSRLLIVTEIEAFASKADSGGLLAVPNSKPMASENFSKLIRSASLRLAKFRKKAGGSSRFKVAADHRLSFVRDVSQPLLLVSEVQRSGGSLFCDLLNGHPQIHAHPGELKIGTERPAKYHWPKLDLSAPPAQWFENLWDPKILRYARDGYSKGSKSKVDRLPFLYSPDLQKAIFLKRVQETTPRTSRAILNCYLTSYFNAWIDYQGLYREPASVKYWSALAPRLTFKKEHCTGLFTDYPDGFLISIIRNPVSWFASARRHKVQAYGDLIQSTELWLESTNAALRNLKDHPGKVHLVHFDDLIQDTEGTMRKVCAAAGMTYDASLLTPSFNGLPLRPNTSFPGQEAKPGTIIKDTIHRGSDLTDEESAYLKEKTDAAYAAALAVMKNG